MLGAFCEQRRRERGKEAEGWEEGEASLPEGWRSRPSGKQGKQIFIGPDGSQFMTRRLAIKHMIGEGYSEQELEATRAGLSEEGWQEDGLLPRAWRFKTVAGRRTACCPGHGGS